jgi:hypothetical protein
MISSILDLLGGDKSQLVSPSEALPGRTQKMPNIDGLKHYVLGNDITKVPEGHEVAVFANGCFWGSESEYKKQLLGVFLAVTIVSSPPLLIFILILI